MSNSSSNSHADEDEDEGRLRCLAAVRNRMNCIALKERKKCSVHGSDSSGVYINSSSSSRRRHESMSAE